MSEIGFSEFREDNEGNDTPPLPAPAPPLSRRQQELIDANGWGDTERVNELIAQGVAWHPDLPLHQRQNQSSTHLSLRDQREIDDAGWGNVSRG